MIFECGALDEFGDLGQIAAAAGFLDGRPHHARAGNAHVDHAVRFTGAVEGTCHEGVVLRRVAEDHQLRRTDAFPVGGELGGFFTILPILATASMLMPALVLPTLMEEQTKSVSDRASGMLSIRA